MNKKSPVAKKASFPKINSKKIDFLNVTACTFQYALFV